MYRQHINIFTSKYKLLNVKILIIGVSSVVISNTQIPMVEILTSNLSNIDKYIDHKNIRKGQKITFVEISTTKISNIKIQAIYLH